MRIGLIIPCYNEEKRINTEMFIKFIKEKENYHLCFVNDGSKDETLSLLNIIKTEVPTKISIVDMKKNKGKIAAIRAGARYLFNRQNVDYIGYMNANAFSDFNDFDGLMKEIETSFNSKGSFKSIQSSSNLKKGMFKNLFSIIIKKLSKRILKVSIDDQKFKLILFRRKLAPIVYESHFYSSELLRFEILYKIINYCKNKDLGYTEINKAQLIYAQN